MTEISLKVEGKREAILSIVMFAGACLIFFLSVLRVDFSRTQLLDLGPQPDATEYFAMARAIYDEGWPFIRIGPDQLPSRYPPGYSILQLPWLAILAEDRQVLAPFRTNQCIALVLLIVSFVIYYLRGRRVAAGAAALLLVSLPAFSTFARSSMSEMTSAFIVVICAILVEAGLRRRSAAELYFAAALLGFGINVRLQLLFFGPVLLAILFIGSKKSRILGHTIGCFFTFLVFASPIFIYNQLTFGSPLQTGYHFWIPAYDSFSQTFALGHIKGNVLMFWDELMQKRANYTVSNIFGTGAHITLPFVVLAVTGAVLVKKNLSFVIILAGAVTLFLFSLLYFYHDIRLFFPLLLLLIPLAVEPVEQALRTLLRPQLKLASSAVIILFCLTLLGFPAQAGFPPVPYTFHTKEAIAWANLQWYSRDFATARFISTRLSNQSALVLSDVSPAYLNALIPSNLHAAPIDAVHYYRFSKQWTYGPPEAALLVRRALSEGRSVYATYDGPAQMSAVILRLPIIPAMQWHSIHESTPTEMGLLKLEPVE